MGNLGVFRDEFYNAIHVLTEAQAFTGPVATGVIPASQLAGAAECFLTVAGTSQTFTTDSAVNIIAQLSAAVNAAYKANVGGLASGLGAQPAVSGIPNLFNLSWIVNINTTGVVTAGTLAPGAGVTLAAIGTLSSTALSVGAGESVYVVTVTSAYSVTMTRVQ
jgi:hypothetical protein